MSKDLVEVLVVGGQPAVAGSAADEAVHGAEGTVARYRLVGRVLQKGQPAFCEPVGRDRSVAEVGREHERVVRGDLQPAELRRLPLRGVDRDQWAVGHASLAINAAHHHAVPYRDAVQEGIATPVEEGDVEWPGAAGIGKRSRSEESRVGKEGVSTGRSRWGPDH